MAETPNPLEAELAAILDAMEGRRAQFVRENLVDLNGAQAAVRAGFSVKTARAIAYNLIHHEPDVGRAVQLARQIRAVRTEITADKVLRELWAVASADPADLIEYRRVCCRHCWGTAFKYQETPQERATRYATWEKERESVAGFKDGTPPEFDEQGGADYLETNDPNPDCPECAGQGEGRAFVKDTRDLSPEARRLYAGVKVTKDGVQVVMQDRVGALTQVGRHLGMFTDKQENTHRGGLTINVRRFTPEPGPTE